MNTPLKLFKGTAALLTAEHQPDSESTEALDAPVAAVFERRNSSWEFWRGTRVQLEEAGIALGGPWPAEPGGKRWAVARDQRGHKTVLTADLSSPGVYDARINLVMYVSERRPAKALAGPATPKARRKVAPVTKWTWTADGGRQRKDTPNGGTYIEARAVC